MNKQISWGQGKERENYEWKWERTVHKLILLPRLDTRVVGSLEETLEFGHGPGENFPKMAKIRRFCENSNANLKSL